MTISVNFEMGNTNVRIVRIVTDSTLAQVTTAGWYSNAAPNQLQPTDEVEIAYAQGSNSAATAFFSVSITAGIVTLSVADSGVILPVVAGHFANFSGTSGAIADDGYLPSNAALARVVMQSAASVSGNIPQYNDVNGTLVDSGLAESNIVAKNASNQLAAGAAILLDKSTGTVSTGAVTVNKQSGVITAAVTTAGAATTSITFNNSEIVSTSVLLVSLMGGTNTTLPGPQVNCVYTSPGVATINITNNNVAGTALNGNLLIGFVVL